MRSRGVAPRLPRHRELDFDSLFGASRDSGYTGPVTLENFSSAVVHPSLSNALAVWRNLWDDSRDPATHAHAFMAERLQA